MDKQTDGAKRSILCRRTYSRRVIKRGCRYTRKGHGKSKGKEKYLAPFILCIVRKALRHGSNSSTCKLHHAYLSFVAFTRGRRQYEVAFSSRHPIAAIWNPHICPSCRRTSALPRTLATPPCALPDNYYRGHVNPLRDRVRIVV